MKTVGEILKQTRIKKNLTLEEIEKQTKIRKKILRAFEDDDFFSQPSFAFSLGLLKNYSNFLGLSSEEILAIYRRQRQEEKITLLPEKIIKPPQTHIGLKKNLIFITLLFLIIFYFLHFLFDKPYLKLYFPKKDIIVKERVIEVKGKTDPKNELLINNQKVLLKDDGNFSEKITLIRGENTLLIVVRNQQGKERRREIKINYQ